MPLFPCSQCGGVENTALSNYWVRGLDVTPTPPPLCSACDPKIGAWHGEFPRRPAAGMLIGADGFLYAPAEVGQFRHVKMIGPYGACRCPANTCLLHPTHTTCSLRSPDAAV